MKHATMDNFDEIMGVFKQYGDLFPHIRGDKMTTMIEGGNVVWEDKVLITYNHYKRKQKLGLIEQSMQKEYYLLILIKKMLMRLLHMFLQRTGRS